MLLGFLLLVLLLPECEKPELYPCERRHIFNFDVERMPSLVVSQWFGIYSRGSLRNIRERVAEAGCGFIY